jgi:hypothetical protein
MVTQTYSRKGGWRGKFGSPATAIASPCSGCLVSEPMCLVFSRGGSTETCSESKVQFPIPFGSEQLIPCWYQSGKGALREGEREAESGDSCQQEKHRHGYRDGQHEIKQLSIVLYIYLSVYMYVCMYVSIYHLSVNTRWFHGWGCVVRCGVIRRIPGLIPQSVLKRPKLVLACLSLK